MFFLPFFFLRSLVPAPACGLRTQASPRTRGPGGLADRGLADRGRERRQHVFERVGADPIALFVSGLHRRREVDAGQYA